jgi:PucR C-terminal helix-turn-helix domain/GGDEF-like domain
MQRARALENSQQSVPDRGADASAPRSTPLTLVAGAVAGDDLQSVAATVAQALGCPVAIAIPALGDPVVCPPGSISPDGAAAIAAHAAAIGEGRTVPAPALIVEAVAVQIGDQVVGIVAAAAADTTDDSGEPSSLRGGAPERRAWLQAAAAAAAVTALIGDAHAGGARGARGARGAGEALLGELAAGPLADLPGFLVRARRLGLDLAGGGVAISARRVLVNDSDGAGPARDGRRLIEELSPGPGALVADRGPGRVLAVAPLAVVDGPDLAGDVVAGLRSGGVTVAVSAPRRDPALLHEAIREAELLAELAESGGGPEAQSAVQDETYRLLIGVLLRERAELELLRDSTITPLADYDARHDTELLETLRAFLAHDGSTTETADAMKLHRHTVGYRLSRVHEVSGLSPYESDGRERLSLGIKAHQILDAERRLHDASPAR